MSADDQVVTVRVSGRFDYSIHKEFREACMQFHEQASRYVIDLGDTRYIDSSALGMLLVLKERLRDRPVAIDIVNTNREIGRILAIANFQRLFNIA